MIKSQSSISLNNKKLIKQTQKCKKTINQKSQRNTTNLYKSVLSQNNQQVLTLTQQNTNFYVDQPKKLHSLLCGRHKKAYEYVCCECLQLICINCQCYQTFDVSYRWNDMNQKHKIMPIHKYMRIFKQDIKGKVNVQYKQYCYEQEKKKMNKKLQNFNQKIQKIDAYTQQCIILLQEYSSKYIQKLNNIKSSTEIQGLIQIQQRKRQLQIQILLQQISQKQYQQKSNIKEIIENWSTISEAIRKIKQKQKRQNIQKSTSTSRSRSRSELKSKSKNKNKNNNKINSRQTFQQNQDQIKNYLQKINNSKHQNTFSNLFGQLNKIQQYFYKNIGLIIQQFKFFLMTSENLSFQLSKPEQIQGTLLSSYSQHKICHLDQKKLLSSVNMSNSNKQNKNKKQVVSLTNMINRQIHNSNHNHHLPQKKPLKISLYGGYHGKSTLITNYQLYSSKNSNQKIRNQKDHELQVQNPTHIGFGFANLSSEQKQNQIIVFGGYLNKQITQCIFKINFTNVKKQLVGRLNQPLAYFGYLTQKNTQIGSNKKTVYICGGQNSCHPVSTFYKIQFNQKNMIVNKKQLPQLDQPRSSLSLTFHRSNILAVGGLNHQKKASKKVTKFNLQSLNWSRLNDLCYERSNHNCISIKSGFYVIGGWNGLNYLRTIERLDETKNIFHVVMQMKESRSSFGTISCSQSNEIIILGGRNTQELKTCEKLSLKLKSSCYTKQLDFPISSFVCFDNNLI